jgi:hypothetical protein
LTLLLEPPAPAPAGGAAGKRGAGAGASAGAAAFEVDASDGEPAKTPPRGRRGGSAGGLRAISGLMLRRGSRGGGGEGSDDESEPDMEMGREITR